MCWSKHPNAEKAHQRTIALPSRDYSFLSTYEQQTLMINIVITFHFQFSSQHFNRTMLRGIIRNLHTKTSSTHILLSKNETCFVAYHPDIEHPYQQTKPMPEVKETVESILKVDSHNLITKWPNLEQLQAMTYTPSRYWHEYHGRDKRKKYKEYFDGRA